MDKVQLFVLSGLLISLVGAVMFYVPGGDNPDSEQAPDKIVVERQLPQEVEDGQTVPVTLKFKGIYQDIEVKETFSGVKDGENSIQIDNVENGSTVFYQVGPFEETGEITFSGQANSTAIGGEKTLDVVESIDIFLTAGDIESSISTEALIPEELGGFSMNDSYSQDGSDGLVRKSSGIYHGEEDSIYLSVSRYSSVKMSEREVNRIARQQVDAGNQDKVERVTLSTGTPALKTETVNNRSIVNWVHGDLVFEVEAVNPVELAGEVDGRYNDEL